MIAEQWELAPYQLAGFPVRRSEWNGNCRDAARDFWRGTDGTMGVLGLRLTGSDDICSPDQRGGTAGRNFFTSHYASRWPT